MSQWGAPVVIVQHYSKECLRSKRHSCPLFSVFEPKSEQDLFQVVKPELIECADWNCRAEVRPHKAWGSGHIRRRHSLCPTGGSINLLSVCSRWTVGMSPCCVSRGHRAVWIATLHTDWEQVGQKMSSEPLTRSEVCPAQEGALWRGALQSVQRAHIHPPGSLCEYNLWTAE